jgi:Tfp pilus assembly protein PilN
MPSINMIASRRAEKRQQENNIRKVVYAIVAEISFIVLSLSFMSVQYVGINGSIGTLNDKIHKLQPKVAEIQQLQNRTAQIMPKVTTLADAKAQTLFWYNNLCAVTNSLPDKTWLTAIGTSGLPGGPPKASTDSNTPPPTTVGGGDPTLNLTGFALNQSSVGEAMLRMNQQQDLDHAELAFVQSQKTGKIDTVNFQMTVHLKPKVDPLKDGAKDVQKS